MTEAGQGEPRQGFELVGEPYAGESAEGPELAHTRLHIFRHGKKAGGNDVSHEEDIAMELKPEGWEESFAAGLKLDRLEGAQSAAVGSTRLRAQQTAAMERAAGHDAVTSGQRSIEAVMEAMGETGPFERVWIDERLDMPFVKGVTPNFDRLLASLDDPARGYVREMLTLYKEAKERGEDAHTTMHATQVRGIAGIIARYARITPKLGENAEVPDKLERLFGTHGGVQESFWVELVRKVKGEEDVERLLAAIPPTCIGYNTGMQIDIVAKSRDTEPELRIKFATVGSDGTRYEFDEPVTAATIRELVSEFS